LAFRGLLTLAEIVAWATIFFGLSWLVLDFPQAFAAGLAFGFLFLPLNRLPAMSFLGAISYSLYLVHVPIGGRIINVAVRLPKTSLIQFAAVVVATAISIFAAYWFWRLIGHQCIEASELTPMFQRSGGMKKFEQKRFVVAFQTNGVVGLTAAD
jgi:peptidoglycan/LPS O-acetylase OafA/YrhL